jgi:transposase
MRKEPHFFSRRNFGGGSLMIWGAFCGHSKLQLAFLSTKMNSDEYQLVLQNNLLPFIRRFRRPLLTFQQDNASVHASKSTTAWLIDKNIPILQWPACSPDLNPIENLWGVIVRRVYANNRQFQTVAELKTAILQAWGDIEVQLLENLIRSMPNRIFEVIKCGGGYTGY